MTHVPPPRNAQRTIQALRGGDGYRVVTLPTNHPPRTDREIIAAIARYLTDCFKNETPPRIGELAARLGISRTQITRVTQRHTGQSAIQYIRGKQVAYAQHLIRSGMTLTKVAYRAGFGTRGTFFRVFKKVTGITPDQYRRTK